MRVGSMRQSARSLDRVQKCSWLSCENTPPDEAGKSMTNMWTREFPARKNHART
jgi:hypothetical protein